MPPMSSSSGWVHFLIRQGWPQTRRASLRVFDRRCYSSGQSRPSYHHPQQQQQPSELEVKPLFHYTEVRLASYLSGLFFSFMTVMGLNELMSGRALEAKSADEMYHDHQDFAGSSHLEKNKKVETTTTVQGQGELRFRMFASVDVERELMMTPRDVLESLVQDRPRPRIKSRLLTREQVNRMLQKSTPLITTYMKEHASEDPKLFRTIGDMGVVTFSEYLFLLSLLTRSRSGLRISFDIMDLCQGDSILKEEFETFCMVATKYKEGTSTNLENTTLTTHFFGSDSKHALTFEEFSGFVRALQREVLMTEFMEFSRGLSTITERDFAELLLRYTDLSDEGQQEYFDRLESRLPPEIDDRKGVTFKELEQFFILLNNIADFAYVFRLYSKSGSPLDKKQFDRAAKISMPSGEGLSENLIEIVFDLFDKAGDDCLSYEEFFVVMKNRLRRQVRRSIKPSGWEAFKTCVRDEIKIAQVKSTM